MYVNVILESKSLLIEGVIHGVNTGRTRFIGKMWVTIYR